MASQVSQKKNEKPELESCSLPASSSDMDQKLWGALPKDIALSAVAKLSWAEICGLSCTWKKLSEALLHQAFFEEYAGGCLQKPICVLHSRPLSHKESPLRYTVIAGDGDKDPYNLFNLKGKSVATLSHDTIDLGLTPELEVMFKLDSLGAAGCFVLLRYSNFWYVITKSRPQKYRSTSFRLVDRIGTVTIVMNPANGTAKKISAPINNSHLGPKIPVRSWSRDQTFLSGIFKDGESQYQILARSYDLDQAGECYYSNNLPPEEDLGRPNDNRGRRSPCNHATFFLYTSSTNCWTNLLGSNITSAADFVNPVLYKGVIYALLVSDYLAHPWKFNSASNVHEIYYVGETSGRKRWISLAVPVLRDSVLFAHLFVFQGTLMLAVGLPQRRTRLLRSVSIWRLHEELKVWAEAVRMPDPILQQSHFKLDWENFLGVEAVSSNGDYVMLRGDYKSSESDAQGSEVDCILMFNIVTCHWQLVHRLSSRATFRQNCVTLFEHRIDVGV